MPISQDIYFIITIPKIELPNTNTSSRINILLDFEKFNRFLGKLFLLQLKKLTFITTFHNMFLLYHLSLVWLCLEMKFWLLLHTQVLHSYFKTFKVLLVTKSIELLYIVSSGLFESKQKWLKTFILNSSR